MSTALRPTDREGAEEMQKLCTELEGGKDFSASFALRIAQHSKGLAQRFYLLSKNGSLNQAFEYMFAEIKEPALHFRRL